MDSLLAQNELLIDELFHLKNYISLATYDPKEILKNRRSERFVHFKADNNLDLWPQRNDASNGRRHSRRVVQEDENPFKLKIEANVDQVLEDIIKDKEPTATRKRKAVPIVTTPKKKRGRKSKKEYAEMMQEKIDVEELDLRTNTKTQTQTQTQTQIHTQIHATPKTKSKAQRWNLNNIKKLTLVPTVKPQVITHPNHVPKHEFPNMTTLFNSYTNILEDPAAEIPSSEFPAYLEQQNQLVNKIKRAINEKLLVLDLKENVFRNVPPNVKEPTMIKKNSRYSAGYYKPSTNPFRLKNELTHYDHLLAQGLKSSRLIEELRKQKIQRCRRIAQMIEVHFNRLSMEKDRQRKEFQQKIIRLARDTAKEVRKKWLIAAKAYKILEDREKEKERAQQSKEQLSKILDHSSKVLGAQLNKPRNSSVEPSSAMSGKENDFSSDDSETNSDDDVNMSSSSSEDEAEAEIKNENEVRNTAGGDIKVDTSWGNELVDDSKLTIDQLREKYKQLEEIKPTNLNNSELGGFYESDVEIKMDKPSIIDSLTDEQRKELLENESNPILDDNSESDSDNDSGTDISNLSADDEHSDDNENDESNYNSNDEDESVEQPTLGALFGPQKIEDESEDDSVYSEHSNETTPSSSPEHSNEIDSVDEGIPDVELPILLKGTLRPYQKQGLNWLASLYNNQTNGILADEMGLGKTIQTISLLSYIACQYNDWGPHLIVVPTSVMLNWEMEFKRFAPGFKVLTYYGSPQQRKEKRKGWNTPDTFHVCITSYQLVVHDQPIFRRKKWKYMILDEAHNIKNFKSQRWNALLNFNTEHRLLLTGTPLQNNIIELWSLLYFLMPSTLDGGSNMPEGFADLADFQNWFANPVNKLVQGGGGANGDEETKKTVQKLHQVLRPFLLRRLKQDVEKQMPAKYEHIVYCRLSKRQRLLYDDFMSRAQTKETLASGNFLSIINCLMQLRKVCNHPDLFEVRPILTSFAQQKSVLSEFKVKEIITRRKIFESNTWEKRVDLNFLNFIPAQNYQMTNAEIETLKQKSASNFFKEEEDKLALELKGKIIKPNLENLEKYYDYVVNKEKKDLMDDYSHLKYKNDLYIDRHPLIPADTVKAFTIIQKDKSKVKQLEELNLIKPLETRTINLAPTIEKYAFVTPKVVCRDMIDQIIPEELQIELTHDAQTDEILNPFHQAQVKTSIAFPDKSLLQYDCGKLQKLSNLLHEIIPQGHRVLIFTQMSKVLDILEQFLNYNGYPYMRLDGATKIEDRQLLTERFNNDTRVKCFILSSRAGGLGINLTGADTVVFYDSDWNPAMDKQCQDRCHRIGQTRDVHIYRFVSEYTIESNILKKAEQKRQLDNVVIQNGEFTTDYFSKLTVQDLLGDNSDGDNTSNNTELGGKDFTSALEQAEDVEDAKAAKEAMKEVNVDTEDFSEEAAKDDNKSNGNENGNVNEKMETGSESVEADAAAEAREGLAMAQKVAEEDEDDEYDDDEVGHIDQYMIRFIAGGWSDVL
ncbi:chromatin-remodeling protein [Martiniozyma asiatica (nom. inval.)]|nr:chromatin-remodeling protein [Martiniozyma asiatica]